MPARPPSRHELLNDRAYQPRLQLSGELSLPPGEEAGPDRLVAAQAWRALQASPEDLIRDQRELDKLDRAVVAARRQANAARAEAQAARAQVAEVQKDRYPAPVAWGLGALALLAAAGWLHERRRAVDAQHQSILALRTEPVAAPPQEPAPEVAASHADAGDTVLQERDDDPAALDDEGAAAPRVPQGEPQLQPQ